MFITMIFFIFIFRGEIKKLKSVSSSACEWLKLNENYYFVICFCKTTFGGKLGLSSQFCVCLSLSLGHLELCFVFFFFLREGGVHWLVRDVKRFFLLA